MHLSCFPSEAEFNIQCGKMILPQEKSKEHKEWPSY